MIFRLRPFYLSLTLLFTAVSFHASAGEIQSVEKGLQTAPMSVVISMIPRQELVLSIQSQKARVTDDTVGINLHPMNSGGIVTPSIPPDVELSETPAHYYGYFYTIALASSGFSPGSFVELTKKTGLGATPSRTLDASQNSADDLRQVEEVPETPVVFLSLPANESIRGETFQPDPRLQWTQTGFTHAELDRVLFVKTFPEDHHVRGAVKIEAQVR